MTGRDGTYLCWAFVLERESGKKGERGKVEENGKGKGRKGEQEKRKVKLSGLKMRKKKKKRRTKK